MQIIIKYELKHENKHMDIKLKLWTPYIKYEKKYKNTKLKIKIAVLKYALHNLLWLLLWLWEMIMRMRKYKYTILWEI